MSRIPVLFGLIVLFWLCWSGQSAQGRCNEGFTEWENNCYFNFYGNRVSKAKAKEFCSNLESSLLSVKSQPEYRFLLDFLKPIRGFYHLELELKKGKWYWPKDTNVPQFENWHPGQPDLCCGKNVHCVQMDSGTGLWFDEPCTKPGAIACKYTITNATENS